MEVMVSALEILHCEVTVSAVHVWYRVCEVRLSAAGPNQYLLAQSPDIQTSSVPYRTREYRNRI